MAGERSRDAVEEAETAADSPAPEDKSDSERRNACRDPLPASMQELLEGGRKVYAAATARLDKAYEAISDGSGTIAEKRLVEEERDDVIRDYVDRALKLQGRWPPHPENDADAAFAAAEAIGVNYADVDRIFVADEELDVSARQFDDSAADGGAPERHPELASADAASARDEFRADLRAAEDRARREAECRRHNELDTTRKPSGGRGGFGR